MLPRKNRIPAETLREVLRRGKRVRWSSLELAYLPSGDVSRIACIVSAKIEKRATTRNRMKRLLTEAVRSAFPRRNIDGVIRVRGVLPDRQDEVTELVRKLFAQL